MANSEKKRQSVAERANQFLQDEIDKLEPNPADTAAIKPGAPNEATRQSLQSPSGSDQSTSHR